MVGAAVSLTAVVGALRDADGVGYPVQMTSPSENPALIARALASSLRYGTLATLAREPAGTPFASFVACALDDTGQPILLLSALAEHTKNLAVDARASILLVERALPDADPLALGRVTLLGEVKRVDDPDSVSERYFTLHPAARAYLAMRDFAFWRLSVESARWVGGFGRMSWIAGDDWRAA